MNRVFVLSPANCNGMRAQWLLRRNSRADLAQRLRSAGAPLGEVFSFLSALYFRGKLTYAQAFSRPPLDCPGIVIITPTIGLVPHDTRKPFDIREIIAPAQCQKVRQPHWS